jgi:hypothetical protein
LSLLNGLAGTRFKKMFFSGSVDLGVLTKMRDLVPYLSNQYLSSFSKPDIQVNEPNAVNLCLLFPRAALPILFRCAVFERLDTGTVQICNKFFFVLNSDLQKTTLPYLTGRYSRLVCRQPCYCLLAKPCCNFLDLVMP